MARRVIITEEQYNMALSEGLTVQADVAAAGGDVKKAISTAKKEAQKSGANLNDTKITINAKDTNESKFITKKELQEAFAKKMRAFDI